MKRKSKAKKADARATKQSGAKLQKEPNGIGTPPEKVIADAVDRLGRKHDRWRVWSDFCECSALSLYNAWAKKKDIEDRYLNIVKRYTREELDDISKMLACTVLALHENPHQDFLGQLFMDLDINNKNNSQFFTPYHLSACVAKMTSVGVAKLAKKRGFVTAQEPACGAGGMVIALCNALKDQGVNYQQQLVVQAIDIAPTCFHMTYIQLSLLGVPAVVCCGNTLSGEMQETWPTWIYHMNGWANRLQLRFMQDAKLHRAREVLERIRSANEGRR